MSRGRKPGAAPGPALRRASALACLALGLAATAAGQPARASASTTAEFEAGPGSGLVVAAGERADQDLLTLGGDLRVEGEAAGDAVAIRGDVLVRGRVAGDALSLGGRVRLERGARVEGNAFSLFGGVDLEEGASVGGRVRSLAPLAADQEASCFAVAWSRPVLVARLLGLLFWFLAALIATFAAPRAVARSAAELGRHPLRLCGIGLLLAASFGLSLVLSVALIPVFLGIPLLVLLALAGTALTAVALAAVFHAVGERVAERLREGAISGYVEVLTGALVFGILHFVPVLGLLAWGLAVLAGAGAVAATRLGAARRRSP